MKHIFLLLTVLLSLSSCDPSALIRDALSDDPAPNPQAKPPKQVERKKYTGTRETKFSNGKLKTSVEYKEGKRHGKAVQYYENGNVHLSDTYIFGKREGVSKYYYPDGSLYQKTDYINGSRNGWKKEYYKTGQLKYKAGYDKAVPTGEFFAYYKSGKRKPNATLEIISEGWNSSHTSYLIKVKFKGKAIRPSFFLGPEHKGKLQLSQSMVADVKQGVGTFSIDIPKGQMLQMDAIIKGESTNKYKYPLSHSIKKKLAIKN